MSKASTEVSTAKPSRYIPVAVKRDVLETFGFEDPSRDGKCWRCGDALTHKNMEFGHIVAFKHGGKNTFDNLRPLCRGCNGRGCTTENAYEAKMRATDGMEHEEVARPFLGMTRRNFLQLLGDNIQISSTWQGEDHATLKENLLAYYGQYDKYYERRAAMTELEQTGRVTYHADKVLMSFRKADLDRQRAIAFGMAALVQQVRSVSPSTSVSSGNSFSVYQVNDADMSE